jgi:hypothetical protein
MNVSPSATLPNKSKADKKKAKKEAKKKNAKKTNLINDMHLQQMVMEEDTHQQNSLDKEMASQVEKIQQNHAQLKPTTVMTKAQKVELLFTKMGEGKGSQRKVTNWSKGTWNKKSHDQIDNMLKKVN